MVKFIAPYKTHPIGSTAEFDAVTEEWLISRNYAVNVKEALPPLQDPRPDKPLTTREKKRAGRK